jgi:ubiquinone/menaquinone biosynthesis C-methylase UbiE
MIAEWLDNIKNLYAVNPIIFAILYFGTFIPCWYFVFRIIRALKNREVNKLLWYFSIELFLLALPYLYVLIWGRSIPSWVYIVLFLLIIISVVSVIRRISKMLGPDQKAKSQALWDFCGPAYKKAIGHSIPHQEMFISVMNNLEFKNNQYLLDAGCGAGDLEKYICEKEFNFNIRAIDFSAEMIKGAKEKCKNRKIIFRQHDLDKKLPFRDNFFSGVVCIQVAFALPRLGYTLKEFYRVLKKGSRLVLVEPKPEANMGKLVIYQFRQIKKYQGARRIKEFFRYIGKMPFGMVVLLFNLVMDRWERQKKYHFYNLDQLKDITSKAGFKFIENEDTLASQDNLIVLTK